MLRYNCLKCGKPAEAGDATQASRWLAGAEAMPCGHAEADFLPNPA